MRIDYLRSATGDIHGEAVVDGYGDETGVVEAELEDDHGNTVAKTRGVYKTSVVEGDNPFVDSD